MIGGRSPREVRAKHLDDPVFTVTAAAHLSGMHPQTLRQYDRLGVVVPQRTPGRGRRYTPRDVRSLLEVQRLSQVEGVNLAGIRRIMELQREVARLRAHVDLLVSEPGSRIFAAGSEGEVVLTKARRDRVRLREPRAIEAGPSAGAARASRAVVVWRESAY